MNADSKDKFTTETSVRLAAAAGSLRAGYGTEGMRVGSSKFEGRS